MILVIAEHEEGIIKLETFEALACAETIADITGGDITVLFPGNNIGEMTGSFAEKTGTRCILFENELLGVYSLEGYSKAVSMVRSDLSPEFICIPHTAQGSDFAPYLAASQGMDCITGVEEISPQKNGPTFVRTTWHGKVKAEVTVESCAVITVFPGSFIWDDVPCGKAGSVEVFNGELVLGNTVAVKPVRSGNKSVNLKDADIIIAVGNGIAKEENMELIQGLASRFRRSAVAGSRVACDKGWVDYGQQVGMTGQQVAPKVYIAWGISGSMQHIMGMKDSGFIVAVNRDADAPIFQYSDIAVIEDLEVFLPLLIEAFQDLD